MKAKLLALASAGILAGAATAAGAATIVADGNFANSSPTYHTYYTPQPFGPWTVTFGSVDLVGGYWQAPTPGGGSVDLDGHNPGGISQTINLAPRTYKLTFYLSGNPSGTPGVKSLDVSVGSLVNDPFSYTTGSNTRTDMKYVLETVDFTAAGGPTTLSFDSTDASGHFGAVIGGVIISAIPEPATWAMMLFGAGAIGAGLRLGRRKHAMAAAMA